MKLMLCALAVALCGLAWADGTDVSGKWSGSFTAVTGDGQARDGTAVLVLKQNGSEITGTVGPNEDEQHPIVKGKIEGDKIALEIADGDVTAKLDLALAGERLTGDVIVKGGGQDMKAKLDVKRAK